MQYNLMHRGAVIKTFDTSAMQPDEIAEMKRLDGTYFQLKRAHPDALPPMPEDFNNLAGFEGWNYKADPAQYLPANHRY